MKRRIIFVEELLVPMDQCIQEKCVWDSKAAAEMYKKENILTVAKAFHVNTYTARARLVQYGVTIRKRGRTSIYTLNEKAFDNAEKNPEASYFCGLLYTDGSVTKNRVSISLQKQDSVIVWRLRSFLKATHPIRTIAANNSYKNSQPSVLLGVSSAQLAQSLQQYGIVPNKSTRQIPPMSMLSNPHWWRGVVDGDGSVGFRKSGRPYVYITGSKATCEQFIWFGREYADFDVSIQPNNSIWQVTINGYPCQPIIRAMYHGTSLAIPRKLNNAVEIINMDIKPRNSYATITAEDLVELYYANSCRWVNVRKAMGISATGLIKLKKRLGIFGTL